MVKTLSTLLPYGVLLVHIAIALLLIGLVSRNSQAKNFVRYVGEHAILLAFLATFAALLGSLFYSEVMGFEPCVLCWWQRIFLYPQVILFLTALKYKDRNVFRYAWRLSLLALIVSAYQIYANLGLGSILPCTAVGGACSKVYVFAFGYITIPMMSLTIAGAILLIAWANKIYLSR